MTDTITTITMDLIQLFDFRTIVIKSKMEFPRESYGSEHGTKVFQNKISSHLFGFHFFSEGPRTINPVVKENFITHREDQPFYKQ